MTKNQARDRIPQADKSWFTADRFQAIPYPFTGWQIIGWTFSGNTAITNSHWEHAVLFEKEMVRKWCIVNADIFITLAEQFPSVPAS